MFRSETDACLGKKRSGSRLSPACLRLQTAWLLRWSWKIRTDSDSVPTRQTHIKWRRSQCTSISFDPITLRFWWAYLRKVGPWLESWFAIRLKSFWNRGTCCTSGIDEWRNHWESSFGWKLNRARAHSVLRKASAMRLLQKGGLVRKTRASRRQNRKHHRSCAGLPNNGSFVQFVRHRLDRCRWVRRGHWQ